MDKTRTVEQMLSAKFEDMQWNSFESNDHRNIIDFLLDR